MKFHLFHKEPLSNIIGYNNIKDIVKRAVDSEDIFALLFCGAPASKTLFLLGIRGIRKEYILTAQTLLTGFLRDWNRRGPK